MQIKSWSAIFPISIEQSTMSLPKPLNTQRRRHNYVDGHIGRRMELTYKCGGLKHVMASNHTLNILIPTRMQIKNPVKNLNCSLLIKLHSVIAK